MLHYEIYGAESAFPLLLLHSGGMAGVEWQPQLEALATRFRVIVPDLPGHGRSPLNAPRLSIHHIVEALLDLLNHLQLPQVHVCGSSLGGASALTLALTAPERVKRLVVYRISYRKNAATYAQTQAMARPEYWQRFGLQQWLSQLHMPQGDAHSWKTVIARVQEALDPEQHAYAWTLDDLKRLFIPTLLIVGDRDPVAPLEDVLAMYEALPQSDLWVMPHADHITASNTWRAQAFAVELQRFLSRQT